MKTYKGFIEELPHNGIAVVGTNPQGIHGAGAAKWAYDNAGLLWGHAQGLCGKSYGIITKNLRKRIHPSISEPDIVSQIGKLYKVAQVMDQHEFYVFYSADGVNLNGYTPQEMARMFSHHPIPNNIVFEEGFSKLL